MTTKRLPMRHRAAAAAAAAAILTSLAAVTPAWAAPAVLSGPSVARATETARFSGDGFRANTAVTVVVTDPAGNETHHSAVTDARGRLRHDLPTGAAGLYRLKVVGAQGRELAATVVNVMP